MTWLSNVDQLAQALGFRLARHNKHLIYRHPAGAQAVISGSPRNRSDGLKEAEANFRRALRQQEVH